MDNPDISIILPVLHEPDLDQKIGTLAPYLAGRTHEIIVVDDSSDEEFERIKQATQGRPHLRLMQGPHRGKGAAIRQAVEAAQGNVIFYIDADLRVALDNIPRFTDMILKDGYDVVIAQRSLVKTPRSPLRKFFSVGLSVIVRFFMFGSMFFSDTQCGFKAYRGEIIKKLAAKQTIDAGMFDVEYLYTTRCNGLRTAQVEVVPLADERSSRINLQKAVLYALIDLVRIKLKGISGYYKFRS